MLHGLMWLPLLAIFTGLAWAGWNEYRKVEAYRAWAQSYDRAKYDIQAILGQRGRQLIWGKPTRQGPLQPQSISLDDVDSIQVLVDGTPMIDTASASGEAMLELHLKDGSFQAVPFTDSDLALQWCQALRSDLQQVDLQPN